MDSVRFIDMVMILFLLGIMFMVSSECEASERIRFYDTSGGWAKPTWNYADKQWDGSYRIYDSKGKFQGKVTKDRLYNDEGRVQEKYYLFNK